MRIEKLVGYWVLSWIKMEFSCPIYNSEMKADSQESNLLDLGSQRDGWTDVLKKLFSFINWVDNVNCPP